MIFLDRYSIAAAAIGFTLAAVGFSLITLSALSANLLFDGFKIPGVNSLANLSFAIYLLHKSVFHLLAPHFEIWKIEETGGYAFVIAFGASLLAALTLHHLIEKPLLKWRPQF